MVIGIIAVVAAESAHSIDKGMDDRISKDNTVVAMIAMIVELVVRKVVLDYRKEQHDRTPNPELFIQPQN